jgi:vacuolar-type H+-ATPase subunit E/Vma4
MAVEEILAAIATECEESIAAIEADTVGRIERLTSEARSRGEAERDRLAAGRDEAAEVAAARIVNRARLLAERRLRAAREDLYTQAHQRMGERLTGVRGSAGYDQLLEQLIAEARDVLGDANLLIVDPDDVDRVRGIVARLDLPYEVKPGARTLGGVELTAGQGRRVWNTLELRAAKAEPALRQLAIELIPALGGGR